MPFNYFIRPLNCLTTELHRKKRSRNILAPARACIKSDHFIFDCTLSSLVALYAPAFCVKEPLVPYFSLDQYLCCSVFHQFVSTSYFCSRSASQLFSVLLLCSANKSGRYFIIADVLKRCTS